tara:strand:+ start:1946 stop:2206 length:261 start_codon:yes stop_codon:yes gene_type:complete
MSQIREILEGWGNVIKDQFNAVDIVTKTISKKRLEACDPCSIRQGNTCSPQIYGYHLITNERKNGCGCNISAKTLSPTSQCPLGKW